MKLSNCLPLRGRQYMQQLKHMYKYSHCSSLLRYITVTTKSNLLKALGKKCTNSIIYWDTSITNLSFDFPLFLAAAIQEKKRKGYEHSELILLCRHKHDYPTDLFQHLLFNIIIPSAQLYSNITHIHLCKTQEEAIKIPAISCDWFPCYPPGYWRSTTGSHPFNSLIFSLFRNTTKDSLPEISTSRRISDQVSLWRHQNCGDKKLLVVTIRHRTTNGTQRNSNLTIWSQFLNSVDKTRFCPVIVWDTDTLFSKEHVAFDDCLSFDLASVHLHYRFALYEQAYINFLPNNGPGVLCLLNRNTSYISFMYNPKDLTAREEYLQQLGLQSGKSLPWAHPDQRIVWEGESLDVINKEFERMCAIKENG